jgi:hypothetical protein
VKTNDAGPKLPPANSAAGFQNIYVLSERNYGPPIVNGGFSIQDCRFCGKILGPDPAKSSQPSNCAPTLVALHPRGRKHSILPNLYFRTG